VTLPLARPPRACLKQCPERWGGLARTGLLLPHNLGCYPRVAARGGESRGELGPGWGAGFPGELQPAARLVWGVWSGHQLAEQPLLASSVSGGGCGTLGPMAASPGLVDLVQTVGRSSFGTITSPALSLPGSAEEEEAD